MGVKVVGRKVKEKNILNLFGVIEIWVDDKIKGLYYKIVLFLFLFPD